MYSHVHVYTYVYMYVYTCTYKDMYICMYVRMYVCMYVYYTYIYVCMDVCMYTRISITETNQQSFEESICNVYNTHRQFPFHSNFTLSTSQ